MRDGGMTEVTFRQPFTYAEVHKRVGQLAGDQTLWSGEPTTPLELRLRVALRELLRFLDAGS